jgi:hypothetical protein
MPKIGICAIEERVEPERCLHGVRVVDVGF